MINAPFLSGWVALNRCHAVSAVAKKPGFSPLIRLRLLQVLDTLAHSNALVRHLQSDLRLQLCLSTMLIYTHGAGVAIH